MVYERVPPFHEEYRAAKRLEHANHAKCMEWLTRAFGESRFSPKILKVHSITPGHCFERQDIIHRFGIPGKIWPGGLNHRLVMSEKTSLSEYMPKKFSRVFPGFVCSPFLCHLHMWQWGMFIWGLCWGHNSQEMREDQ